MIVLDTDVVSEAMKPSGSPTVRAWLDAQAAETVYLCSATLAELFHGIATLPAGRRKEALAVSLDGLLDLFGPRILPFDADAARCCAGLAAQARAAGCGFPLPDGCIAATAAFEAAGLPVVNPWNEAAG